MIKVYQLRKKQNNYEVVIYYKGVGVKVNFTDGNTYKQIFPKFYTNDPFKQRAIEASELYKSKEVVMLRTIEEEGDSKPEPVKQPETPKNEAPKSKEEQPEEAADGDGLKPMTFENLGEAILYIANEWQVGVQTEKDAREILKAHGIKPTIKKG